MSTITIKAVPGRKRKDGTYPVRIRVTFARVRFHRDQWNAERRRRRFSRASGQRYRCRHQRISKKLLVTVHRGNHTRIIAPKQGGKFLFIPNTPGIEQDAVRIGYLRNFVHNLKKV